MLNEMLLLEVRAHESIAAEGSKERPTPDLVSRVRGYLEMRIHGEWMEALELFVTLPCQTIFEKLGEKSTQLKPDSCICFATCI